MYQDAFVIREGRSYDIDAMVGLLRQLFTIEDDFTFNDRKHRHGCAALMADHTHGAIRVAEVNNRVVGMCTAQINVSTAEGGLSAQVEDLIVDAPYRRRGIGASLLSSIRRWALDHNCVRMQLLADRRNDHALEFYRKAGWKTTNMICLQKKIHEDFTPIPSQRHQTISVRR
jgi:GNAT superfamily N-acetyltransferase